MEGKEKMITSPENTIAGSDAVDLFMANYLYSDKLSNVRENIRKKTQAIDSEHISSRIINHWESEGLISDFRPSGKGWRKYSLIDRVWLEVIAELRKFGFPLERIRIVKQKLEGKSETEDISSMPFLETYFVLAYFFKEPCYLLVFPNGEALLALTSEYEISEDIGMIGNHIRINLNKLLQNLFPGKDLKVKTKYSFDLSTEEMELMLFVRTGNFDSITVKRKNGKIDFLEGKEQLDIDARVSNILKEQDYQSIEIKTVKGKVMCIQRTVKKKVSATG